MISVIDKRCTSEDYSPPVTETYNPENPEHVARRKELEAERIESAVKVSLPDAPHSRRKQARQLAAQANASRRKVPPLSVVIGFAAARAVDRAAGTDAKFVPVHIPSWGTEWQPRGLFEWECRNILRS